MLHLICQQQIDTTKAVWIFVTCGIFYGIFQTKTLTDIFYIGFLDRYIKIANY